MPSGSSWKNRLRPLVHRARTTRDRWLGGSCAVLLYHRVIDIPTDPQLLAVKPAHFDAQLALLKERYHMLTVEEFDHHLLHRRRFPKGSVLLTFDDGYADNHTFARPLLEKHGLQALFFIASGYIGSGREYWWDELERLLLLNGKLPIAFHFASDGLRLDWRDGEVQEAAGKAYTQLLDLLRALPGQVRDGHLAALREQLHAPHQRSTHLPMTWEELRAFAASPAVVIGAHTRSHPSLMQVSPEEQAAEIIGSKQDLEHQLQLPVKYFSYPFGTGADFNATTERLAREAGFLHAAANYPGLVHARSPVFRFPRFLVRDWDAPEFARRMDTFLRG